MSGLLTRDMILQALDLPTERVEVPEWGGAVLVRGMSGTERDAIEQSVLSKDGKGLGDVTGLRARVVAYCVVDEQGQRLFQKSDVERLGAKSALALQRVFEVAQKLSGLSPEDVAELEKN